MTGVEPRTYGIGSNRSTNWATTTSPFHFFSSAKENWATWNVVMHYIETTVYLDRLLIHYPFISNAFDNIDHFSVLYKWFNFDIIEMNSLFNFNKQNIVFHCYKNT